MRKECERTNYERSSSDDELLSHLFIHFSCDSIFENCGGMNQRLVFIVWNSNDKSITIFAVFFFFFHANCDAVSFSQFRSNFYIIFFLSTCFVSFVLLCILFLFHMTCVFHFNMIAQIRTRTCVRFHSIQADVFQQRISKAVQQQYTHNIQTWQHPKR